MALQHKVGVGGALATIMVAVAFGPGQASSEGADPPAGQSYVPEGAAFTAHIDLEADGAATVVDLARRADRRLFDAATGWLTKTAAAGPTDLRGVTVFFPSLAGLTDIGRYGVILSYKNPVDPQKFRGRPKVDGGPVVHVPTPTVLLAGVDIDPTTFRPHPVDPPAATGRPVVTVGVRMGKLPAALRGDDPPADVKPFRPLFRADALTARLVWGRDATLALRLDAATPAGAADAAAALRRLFALAADELDGGAKRVGRDAAAGDDELKPLAEVLRALHGAVAGADIAVDGTTVRGGLRVRVDAPFADALTAADLLHLGAGSRTAAVNNMKQIALAMHNYESANGTFPPPAVTAKDGMPLLSWRVAVLPYLEGDALYREFKQDEPWDGPHNKKLLARMPAVYAIPGRTRPGDTNTHVRVFVGPGAGFEAGKPTRIADISDGTSNTILAVTAADAVPWTKPDEILFDPAADMRPALGYVAADRCIVALMDGSVQALPRRKPLDRGTLNAVITRNGGEVASFP